MAEEANLTFPRTKIEYSFDGPTIVYCPTKKATEAVTRELQGKSTPYPWQNNKQKSLKCKV